MFENLNLYNVAFIGILLVVLVIFYFNVASSKESLVNTSSGASLVDNENTVMITGDQYNDIKGEEDEDTTESDGELSNMKLKIIKTQPSPVINYFGCHQCPHSCQDSNSYKFLTQKFARKFPDIKINVYWNSEEKAQEEFRKNNIEFVPAILNNRGKQMDIDMQNTGTKSLEREIMKNILQQLN